MAKRPILLIIGIMLLFGGLAACSSSEAPSRPVDTETNLDIEEDNENKAETEQDTEENNDNNEDNEEKEEITKPLTDEEIEQIVRDTHKAISGITIFDLMDDYMEEFDDDNIRSEQALDYYYDRTREDIDKYIHERDAINQTFSEKLDLIQDHKYKTFLYPDDYDIEIVEKDETSFTIITLQVAQYYPDNHPDVESGIIDIEHEIAYQLIDDTWKIVEIEYLDPYNK